MKRTRKQSFERIRKNTYRPEGDQLDAIWKILRVLLEDAAPETLARVDPSALQELDYVVDVKRQVTKKKSSA